MHIVLGPPHWAFLRIILIVSVRLSWFLQVAVLHNDIATALDRLDQGSEAEEHVRRSLDIAASLEADENVAESLVTFQYNLGLILLHQGEFSSSRTDPKACALVFFILLLGVCPDCKINFQLQ